MPTASLVGIKTCMGCLLSKPRDLFDTETRLSRWGNAVSFTTSNNAPRGVLMVDHDHETGKVRGLLCHHCNVALGHLQDDPNTIKALLDYLCKQ